MNLTAISLTYWAPILVFFTVMPADSAYDGCPKEEASPEPQEDSMLETAAVRCCNLDGDNCTTPEECLRVSFEKAEEECARIGMRLCSKYELKQNLCCNTGCDFDGMLTWHKDNGM